jgi:nucleotide-binding universal stress UspA family protein
MKTPVKRTRTAKRSAKPAADSRGSFRIGSILVPIDFSTPSLKALSYGAALAEQFGARVTLLYVTEPAGLPDFARAFPLMMENDEIVATCKARLEQVAEKQLANRNLLEKVLVRQGRAYAEITEAAKTLKVDLIVISTHGFSGVSHALLGSVTERVVRHAPCPVLVVRQHEHEFISG